MLCNLFISIKWLQTTLLIFLNRVYMFYIFSSWWYLWKILILSLCNWLQMIIRLIVMTVMIKMPLQILLWKMSLILVRLRILIIFASLEGSNSNNISIAHPCAVLYDHAAGEFVAFWVTFVALGTTEIVFIHCLSNNI